MHSASLSHCMKHSMYISVLIVSLFAFQPGKAQNVNTSESERDSTTIVENTFFDMFDGPPGRAALYGLVIPGGGQIYNKKWWKLPIVYGLEGFLIFNIVQTSLDYRTFQDGYLKMLNGEIQEFMGTSSIDAIRRVRNSARKNREYAWVFFIGGRLITIFEAFIDRHLMDFDVSDDLSFHIIPGPGGPIPAVGYQFQLSNTPKPQKKWSYEELSLSSLPE